jgi:hypothetical protein
MDARDLAPALLAAGQLVDAANTSLNGDSARVKVQVKATGTGSFEIILEVSQTIAEHLIALLTTPGATAAAVLATFVFGTPTANGVLWLIQRLKGKKPTRIERLSDLTVRIIVDGETVDVPIQLLRLYQDVAVRAAAQKLIEEPLRKEGIDVFEVREDRSSLVRIEKGDAQYFTKTRGSRGNTY